jgi:predicted DNA-binding transcriptional regulator YafY
MERRWYLVAWDQARKDWRTFRVDRIAAPIPTAARFASRASPDDDVGSYVARSVSLAPYRHQARVVVNAPIEALRERISPASGRLERIDKKSCRLDIGAPTLDTLAVILGALGADFQVEEPRALMQHLRGMAARLRRAARD